MENDLLTCVKPKVVNKLVKTKGKGENKGEIHCLTSLYNCIGRARFCKKNLNGWGVNLKRKFIMENIKFMTINVGMNSRLKIGWVGDEVTKRECGCDILTRN